jgi:RNA polymerase sigma-70 factor (ECF subfamily)
MQLVRRTIDGLPTNQAQVIRLRDVEGWPAEEVCNAMDLSKTNQRVLLHRARSKVRQVLERYFDGEGEGVGHPS